MKRFLRKTISLFSRKNNSSKQNFFLRTIVEGDQENSQKEKGVSFLLSLASKTQKEELSRFMDYSKGNLSIDNLKAYSDHLKQETALKSSTIATKLYTIKGAFKKFLDANFDLTQGQRRMIEMKLKKIKIPSVSSKLITEEKIIKNEDKEAIFELKNKYSIIVEFLYYTGCRISEALQIRKEDIKEFDDKVVVSILGKGAKIREIKIRRSLYKRILCFYPYEYSDFLFYTFRKTPYHRTAINRFLKKALKDKNINPHQFRHSFATKMINKTNKIKETSQYLGHSTTAMTLDMYCHGELKTEEIFETMNS